MGFRCSTIPTVPFLIISLCATEMGDEADKTNQDTGCLAGGNAS